MSTLHGQKSKISVCGYVYVRACVCLQMSDSKLMSLKWLDEQRVESVD